MSPPCLGGKIIGTPERRAVDQRGVPGKRGLVNCDMFGDLTQMYGPYGCMLLLCDFHGHVPLDAWMESILLSASLECVVVVVLF